MSEFTIQTTDVPATTNGRQAGPNVFAPEGEPNKFTTLDEGKAMTIRLSGDEAATADQVKSLTSQARKAATAVDLTARVKVTHETEGTGKSAKPVTVFTTWGRPKITRPRTQGESQEAAASAANPNTATE